VTLCSEDQVTLRRYLTPNTTVSTHMQPTICSCLIRPEKDIGGSSGVPTIRLCIILEKRQVRVFLLLLLKPTYTVQTNPGPLGPLYPLLTLVPLLNLQFRSDFGARPSHQVGYHFWARKVQSWCYYRSCTSVHIRSQRYRKTRRV
jgi:hypothetical protein